MISILLVDRPILNYFFSVPSILVYTIIGGIFLSYYKKYQHKGFVSIAMGMFSLGFHHFLRFYFFLFLQESESFTTFIFLRFMLLTWGLSFTFMLHGMYQFRYNKNEFLLFLVYVFYGAFLGLSLFLPEIDLTYNVDGYAKVLIVPEPIVVMTTIIHFFFIFELISISRDTRKQFHKASKISNYWILTTGAILLVVWLAFLFSFKIVELRYVEPFIPLLGFILWAWGIFKHPNYLFYPKYVPHVLFVSRTDGTLIYHHDFFDIKEVDHQDDFPNFSLLSGLFASLRMASTELFTEYEDFMFYGMGTNTAVIYQYDEFLITLLVNNRTSWHETLLKKLAIESSGTLNDLGINYTLNLCQPVQEVFGLPT